MSKRKALVIGICGVTCGGKTTLATELMKVFPGSVLICQDDYFLDVQDKRHVWIPEINHINFDVITSLDMGKMYKDIVQSTANRAVIHHRSKSENITFPTNQCSDVFFEKLCNRLEDSLIDIIIVEGFSIFNYKPILPFFHLKYYITLDHLECLRRRTNRVYDPPDCPGYFEKCAWPEYINMLKEVKCSVDGITYIDGMSTSKKETVLMDIYNNFLS